MRAMFSLFPWDIIGDPAAARALKAAGVDRVALAATYHATRAATPRHPLHRIVNIDRSANYTSGSSPLPPAEFSFEQARDELESVGIEVTPWVVLGHVDRSREDLPRVVDAFGTDLVHALCLRSPEVTDYIRATMDGVREVAHRGLVVEGAAWSGAGHASLHDKVSAADLDLEALSWCFCSRCAAAADVDPSDIRAALTAGDPVDPASVARIRGARAEAATLTRRRIASESCIEGLMFHPDADADAPDEFLFADAWAGPDPALRKLRERTARGAYVTILGAVPPRPEELAAQWAALATAGCEELLIYHAGLASTTRLTAALTALKGIA